MKNLILIALVLSLPLTSYASNQRWNLNDVSYLLPLSQGGMRAQDVIPYKWFSEDLADQNGYHFSVDATKLSSSSVKAYNNIAKESFNNTRLVSLRIDPCFKDLFSDPCRMQVRGVWQPLDKRRGSVDATIHTFHDLNEEEFIALSKALRNLKEKFKINTTNLPLQVHPGFKSKEFTKEFITLTKSYMKEKQISRIAFMKLNAEGLQWRFLGFNIREGRLSPMEIPVRTGKTQTFSVHGGHLSFGFIEFNEEERARIKNGTSLYRIFIDYAMRIENPELNLPGTTDCLSCHATDGLKGAAAKALRINPIPLAASSLQFMGKYNLTNTSGNREDRNHFRGFGYSDRNPAISDRVIIESAMVADGMNLLGY